MQNLLNPKFSACTARWSERGEVFKRLSAEEQRRLAMLVIARAGPCKTLRLSVIIKRDDPPAIEYHRQKKTIRSVTFHDRERALRWIIEAYGQGLAVYIGNLPTSGIGHPCEGRT